MPLETIGDVEFEAQPDWSLTVDDYGVDTLSRPYRGYSELLAEFLKANPKRSQDAEFPQLKRTGYSVSGDRSFPTVTLNYKGLFDDDLPDVKRSGGWRRQTVTLYMQDANGGADTRVDSATQCTVVYYAPTSSFRYVTRKQPTKPRYEGVLLAAEANWQIRQIRGAGAILLNEAHPPLWQAGIVTGGVLIAGRFNYVRTVGTSIFTFEEAGDYWEVTEENEGLIEMVERADMPRLLTSGDLLDVQSDA